MFKLHRASMRDAAKIMAVAFACAAAISFLSVYYTHQIPTYETRTSTICTYQHVGTYDYAAKLKPNIIYRKEMLKPGEGTLYTNIVEYVNLTFTYSFKSSPNPKSVEVGHRTTIQIESPARWLRTLSEAEAQELFQLSGGLNWTMQVNSTKVRQFVEAIDREIYGAARSATYSIKIKTEIHLAANIAAQAIDETFTPEITVAYKTDAEKGNHMAIENLKQTKSGAITETDLVPLPWVQNQRATSYIAAASTTAALAASALLYVKNKPPAQPAKTIEKLTAPYRELIAKTAQRPPETKTTIETETLEDLAKIAEILARPILHTTEAQEHIFYIIDNETKYQHKTKAF